MKTYSWYGTNIHFLLNEEVAETYNRALEKWYEAQRLHHEFNEKRWDYKNESISIDFTEEELRVWNGTADVINAMSKLNGGGFDISEEDITEEGFILLEDP